jgi:hypothetical protein
MASIRTGVGDGVEVTHEELGRSGAERNRNHDHQNVQQSSSHSASYSIGRAQSSVIRL